ncbi:MAG: glycosyltransferase [Acidobacteriota bacterium]|nr:glycosyltransferase [Acidobacteriota bacterium]
MFPLAQLVFWSAVFALFYAYLGYPLLLALLSLLRGRGASGERAGYAPAVSLLIAAYNEEESIERKIRETLALRYPAGKLEILVVSDGSCDRTDEIVRSFPDGRVRLLRVEGRRGKTNAQNQGVSLCRGEVIVFSDATATYHPESIERLVAPYADDRGGAVSGRYKYFDLASASPTGLGSIAFWNYENVIKTLQSRLGTLTGCSGCIYSVRKSCYVPLPDDACSDLVEPLNVVKGGHRVAFAPEALAYEETTASSAQEFRMRVRVATRGMRGILSVTDLLQPWRHPWTAFQLFSHKIMRWLVPVFLAILFLSNLFLLSRMEYRVLAALQLAFYAFAVLSLVAPLHKRWKPLGLPLFFCTLNAAAAIGLWQVLRGNKFTTWETVRNAHELPGHGTKIGAFVEVQGGASIGSHCKISSHSFVCSGVAIGDGSSSATA